MKAALLLVAPAGAAAYGQTPPPSLSLDKDSKCRELRTFTAAPGKLAPLYARFCKHSDWLKARDESKKDGKLTARVESVIMGSTSYGPVKWLRR